MPAEQARQEEAEALPGVVLNVPSRQGRHAVLESPPAEGLKVFTGQALHTEGDWPPSIVLKKPAVQFVQKAWPVLGLYEPAAQLVHDPRPAPLNFPAAQLKQAEELVAPCVLLKVPAGQALQVVEPAALQDPRAQHTPAPALL